MSKKVPKSDIEPETLNVGDEITLTKFLESRGIYLDNPPADAFNNLDKCKQSFDTYSGHFLKITKILKEMDHARGKTIGHLKELHKAFNEMNIGKEALAHEQLADVVNSETEMGKNMQMFDDNDISDEDECAMTKTKKKNNVTVTDDSGKKKTGKKTADITQMFSTTEQVEENEADNQKHDDPESKPIKKVVKKKQIVENVDDVPNIADDQETENTQPKKVIKKKQIISSVVESEHEHKLNQEPENEHLSENEEPKIKKVLKKKPSQAVQKIESVEPEPEPEKDPEPEPPKRVIKKKQTLPSVVEPEQEKEPEPEPEKEPEPEPPKRVIKKKQTLPTVVEQEPEPEKELEPEPPKKIVKKKPAQPAETVEQTKQKKPIELNNSDLENEQAQDTDKTKTVVKKIPKKK